MKKKNGTSEKKVLKLKRVTVKRLKSEDLSKVVGGHPGVTRTPGKNGCG